MNDTNKYQDGPPTEECFYWHTSENWPVLVCKSGEEMVVFDRSGSCSKLSDQRWDGKWARIGVHPA